MAGTTNGERVREENTDERLKQTLKDMNNSKTRKSGNEAPKESVI